MWTYAPKTAIHALVPPSGNVGNDTFSSFFSVSDSATPTSTVREPDEGDDDFIFASEELSIVLRSETGKWATATVDI